ncbi:MAG: hypothetical protein R3B96_24855 [Pirellulaceae bacterium]
MYVTWLLLGLSVTIGDRHLRGSSGIDLWQHVAMLYVVLLLMLAQYVAVGLWVSSRSASARPCGSAPYASRRWQ